MLIFNNVIFFVPWISERETGARVVVVVVVVVVGGSVTYVESSEKYMDVYS